MNRELIIDVTKSDITIALLEDRVLVELNKEKTETGHTVGDIYLGKVKKIMPGLNAAFVGVGHEKDAFIHYQDLGPQFTTVQKLTDNIITNKQVPKFSNLKLDAQMAKTGVITDFVKGGQSVLVQVTKEAISTKGPRVSADISLAGRNVVLIPFSNKVNISTKIRAQEEKKRLKRIADKMLPKNYGVIIRTAAMGKSDEDLENDISSLIQRWESALAMLKGAQPPRQLLSEMGRTATIVRDSLNGSFQTIAVNDKTLYDEIREYVKTIEPGKEKIVRLYKSAEPIFEHYDVARQIKSLFARYVSLKKGAYLIMDHAEAMHVIDVNSGNRSKAGEDQEQTVMEVNLQAAAEIARQLRLRDLGGIIVIDFIDLHKSDNRQQLLEKMQMLMATDKAKHTILPLTKFGLMQITRQRVRPLALEEAKEKCPTCGGTGNITPTVLLDEQIESKLSYWVEEKGLKFIRLQVSPFVEAFLRRGFPSLLLKWQFKYNCRIKLLSDMDTGFVEVRFYDKEGIELE